MGQEWGASTPFQYFTDHHEELGKRVTEGRREEFQSFRAYSDAAARSRIPDPQDPRTYAASRLVWEEREQEPHASLERLYRRLLGLRREECLRPSEAVALGSDSLALRARSLLTVVRLSGAGVDDASVAGRGGSWVPILTTEEPEYAPDPQAPEVAPDGPLVRFQRPGAVVFRRVGDNGGESS